MMKYLKKSIMSLRKLLSWYSEPIPGHKLLRVDPILVVAVIGIITTSWGVGRGFGKNISAETMATQLREANYTLSNQITQAHNNNQITGYEREVALQRLNMLTPIFNQYADIIEYRGNEELIAALELGIYESAVSLSPGETTGRLIRGITYGKGIDQILSIACISNTLQNFDWRSESYSAEQEQLRKRIQEIFGIEADALFKARFRSKINFLRQEWTDKLKQMPCQPDKAMGEYRAWAYERARIWAEVPRLYGEGEKWATYDDFLNWAINEARGEGGEKIILTWEGDYNITSTPLVGCFACVPPNASGTLQIVVNLETCTVNGSIQGEGEGNVTINDCINNVPIEATCTSHGKIDFLGNITGSVKLTGNLSFNPTSVTINHSHGWIAGCENASHAVTSETWEDNFTITGSLNWTGNAKGSIEYNSGACILKGDFDIPRK